MLLPDRNDKREFVLSVFNMFGIGAKDAKTFNALPVLLPGWLPRRRQLTIVVWLPLFLASSGKTGVKLS